jgi:hypothetical protein
MVAVRILRAGACAGLTVLKLGEDRGSATFDALP